MEYHEADPRLRDVRYAANPDPRPQAGTAELRRDASALSEEGGEAAPYRGAFGSENWLEEWTFFGLESDYDTRAPDGAEGR